MCISYDADIRAIQYNYGKGKVWYALITLLYVDILGESQPRLGFQLLIIIITRYHRNTVLHG